MNLDMLAELIAPEIPPDATDGELGRLTRSFLTSFAKGLTETSTVGQVAIRVRALHESQAPPPGAVRQSQAEAHRDVVYPDGAAPGQVPIPLGRAPGSPNGHPRKLHPYSNPDLDADKIRDTPMADWGEERARFGLNGHREGIFFNGG